MSIDIEGELSSGNLLLSPVRIDTVTRNGTKAIVFAETGRRYFGCYYGGDVHGWQIVAWFKPSGCFLDNGNASPLDLNLTSQGVHPVYDDAA